MSPPKKAIAGKWIGLAAGIALAAGLVLSWGVPATGGQLGADVRMLAAPTGELEVRPTTVFLSGDRLLPGRPGASGALAARNITARPLIVEMRLTPSSAALDRALRVRVEADGDDVVAQRLGSLRLWTDVAVTLAPGERAVMRLHAGLPAGPAAAEAGGQAVEVTAELRGRPVGGRR